jgi:hypothetical protein
VGTTRREPKAEPSTAIEPPELDDLVAALHQVIRRGLPIAPGEAPQVLIELRGVRARAIDQNRYLSLVKALNDLLWRLLRDLGDSKEAQALRALFDADATNRGTTLTERRRRANTFLNYDPTHFRRNVEPRLLKQFAWLLHADSQNYTPRSRKTPPKIEISGDTPALTLADINEQEELVSRIWALVYELRAELIHKARLEAEEDPAKEAEIEDAEGTSLWLVARLLTRIHEYLDRYGERILHGEAEFNVEGLIRLAGWSYELTPAEVTRLRYVLAKVGHTDRQRFLTSFARSRT